MKHPVIREIVIADAMQNYVQQGIVLKVNTKKKLLQGNDIIQAANDEADSRCKNAEREAEKIIADAKVQYNQGFDSGFQAGKKEALQEGLGWLMQVNETKEAVLDQVKSQVINTIEHALLHVFAMSSSDWIKQQLNNVLVTLDSEEKVELHVSETTATKLVSLSTSQPYHRMTIQVISEPSLKDDYCLVKTRYFEMECSLDNLHNTIIETIKTAFNDVQI